MNFEINLKIMKEIYGEEIEEIILDNMNNIKTNVATLEDLDFKDIQGIFEMYPALFMNFPKQFKEKIEKLRNIYGKNFVDKIENDLTLVEVIED